MLRRIRYEDVWGNSRLEGLQGEGRDYVYDRGRTTVSEQWRARSMLVDEGFQSYYHSGDLWMPDAVVRRY